MVKILIEPSFHFHPKYKEIYQMVKTALVKFPEIDQVRLGAFYPTEGSKHKADANWALGRIKFNVKRDISIQTVSHELYHLIQEPVIDKKSVMPVEREATLLGFARLNKTQIKHNRLPYVVTGGIPLSKISKYAKFAETEKKKGNPKYIEDTIKKIKQDKANDIKNNPNNAKNWEYKTKYDQNLKIKFEKHGKKNFANGFTEIEVKKFLKEYVGKVPKNYLKEEKGWDVAYAYDVDKMKKKPEWMNDKTCTVKKTKPKTK